MTSYKMLTPLGMSCCKFHSYAKHHYITSHYIIDIQQMFLSGATYDKLHKPNRGKYTERVYSTGGKYSTEML